MATACRYQAGPQLSSRAAVARDDAEAILCSVIFYFLFAEDGINGRSRNYKKALLDAGVTLATGVGFDSAIGATAAKRATAQIGGNVFENAASIDFQHLVSTYRASQVYSNSVQARQQAVQTYNTGVSGGAASRLYVTPNGAVINWGGLVITSAPPTKK